MPGILQQPFNTVSIGTAWSSGVHHRSRLVYLLRKQIQFRFRFFHQEMLAFCSHVWRATNGSGGCSFRAAARIGLRALPSLGG